jgi:hypothetical protein
VKTIATSYQKGQGEKRIEKSKIQPKLVDEIVYRLGDEEFYLAPGIIRGEMRLNDSFWSASANGSSATRGILKV